MDQLLVRGMSTSDFTIWNTETEKDKNYNYLNEANKDRNDVRESYSIKRKNYELDLNINKLESKSLI